MLKTKFPYVHWGRGGGSSDQLPAFDAESKAAKKQISLCLLGEGVTNFQFLMLSPNLLKTKFYYVQWGLGGGVSSDQLPTFDAECKSAKILFPVLEVLKVCQHDLSWLNTNGPCILLVRETTNSDN